MSYGVPDIVSKPVERVIRLSPRLERTVLRFYSEYYLKPYIRLYTYWKYGRHHDATIDPFRTLWVDPADVQYRQAHPKPKGGHEKKLFSYVLNGEWDQNVTLFEKNTIYQFLRNWLHCGTPPDETEFFDRISKKLEQQETVWNGCRSIDDFYERCQKVRRLYDDIAENGIQSHEELRESGIETPPPDNVTVNIGRDGRLIYLNGRHRLSIAKILDLESIPVHVMVRHEQWQRIRDEVARADDIETVDSETRSYLAHPDVKYLWESGDP